MSGGVKNLTFGIVLVLVLSCFGSIQTQGSTWSNFRSMYEYTTIIYYKDYLESYESTYEDSLKVWNVTVNINKLYFRTNFTPYFMGLMHFETQEQYDAYLAEHYWYDNDTDSMSIAYSVVDTNFYFVDMLDYTISYNATITNFDIRLLGEVIYGLFLPVNHSSFNFKSEYPTGYMSEKSTHDVNFQQKNTFTLDRMRYDGYYLYLEYYITDSSSLDCEIEFNYKYKVMYSLIGELYYYEMSRHIYDVCSEKNMYYFHTIFSLNQAHRINGTEVSWLSPLVILSSLLIATYSYSKFRRYR